MPVDTTFCSSRRVVPTMTGTESTSTSKSILTRQKVAYTLALDVSLPGSGVYTTLIVDSEGSLITLVGFGRMGAYWSSR